MPSVTVADLLEAGVHFGHQTRRWNPKMKKYIFAERNGIHIIDLNKTLTQVEVACGFLYDLVMSGGSVLFVGTKKQAQQEIKEAATRTRMPFVVDRWLGGTLTNLRTIRNSVGRLKKVDQLLNSPDAGLLPKKEIAQLRRESFKLHRNLDGIIDMERLPSAAFVVDIDREAIAVHEATRLKIPIVAVVDTNCDPDRVTYPIAGNDDAIRAIKMLTGVMAAAIAEAQGELNKSLPAPAAAEAPPAPVPGPEPVPTVLPAADVATQPPAPAA